MIITHNGNIIMSDGFILNKVSSTPTPPSFADTNSFQFDGVTDYIVPLITSGLDFSGSFTLMAWVKTNAIGSNQFIIDTSTSSSSGNGYSVRINTDGKIRFWSYAVAGLVNSTTVLGTNIWYHIACVHDTVAGTNKIYIDGILDNTSSYTFPTASNTTNLRIGRSNLFAGSFNGFINEVGFFGTDLSANINSIFNGGLPDSLTSFNPSSWFRMGEEATWDGSKFVLDNQGSIGGTATSVGILPTNPNPTTDVPLFDNKSFTYDGTIDTINIGSTPLDLRFNRLDTFSFSAWVKVDTTQNNVIIANQRAPSTNYRGYYFAVNSSNQIIVILRSNLSDRLIFTSTSTISNSQWYHIAFTYDGTASTSGGNIYIDSILDTLTRVGGLTATMESTDQLYIGSRNSADNFFNGNINDTSIFNTELSQNDILTIFNGGVPNNISALSPISYWRAEQVTFDGTNWTMIDQGSGANNGTSVSMPLTSRTSDVPT